MRNFKRKSIQGVAVAVAVLLTAPFAAADRGGSHGRGEAGVRSSAPRVSVPAPARSNRGGTPSARGTSSNSYRGTGNSAGRYPILEALRNAQYSDHRYDNRHGYRHDDDYADAAKTAAIANAVVGVVGILANANRPYCPPPVVVAPPAPCGHYVTERVLVQPGHYEQIRAWVPQSRDPYTGCMVGGYYEVHQRWVPEVYETRQVWVVD